jgi:hypothetical protein
LDVISPKRETRLDWGGLSEGCDEGGKPIEGGDRDWEPSTSGSFEERMGSNLLNEKCCSNRMKGKGGYYLALRRADSSRYAARHVS